MYLARMIPHEDTEKDIELMVSEAVSNRGYDTKVAHIHLLPRILQHLNTPDNTVETRFDFTEENYQRVEMVT
jgi:hypothetical protein